jgi:3',5'-cyclic-nucleotide phosphodiesterase
MAVDAGVHLSAIRTILEQTQPTNLGQSGGVPLPHTLKTGPFAGLEVPYARAEANAAHIYNELIETYLITHPHLDHIAGMVINTACPPAANRKRIAVSKPKTIAALPDTIDGLRTHIFNNVIWPDLSEAGLVTYMRLVEGGSPLAGEGDGIGYTEVCTGLAVKVWSVSHGSYLEKHNLRGSISSRHHSFDASSVGPTQIVPYPPSRNLTPPVAVPEHDERMQTCVSNSSVYFIKHVATGREILIFGDVEPDSLSLKPRNSKVWQQAAPRFVDGKLAAIFIECSYDNSRRVEQLFGHMTPRYINEEMKALAEEVVAVRQSREGREAPKRKRGADGNSAGTAAKRQSRSQSKASRDRKLVARSVPARRSPRLRSRASSPASSASEYDHDQRSRPLHKTLPRPHPLPSTTISRESSCSLPTEWEEAGPGYAQGLSQDQALTNALKGLKVVIIHVKESMADGDPAWKIILNQLNELEQVASLGVEYEISEAGKDYRF